MKTRRILSIATVAAAAVALPACATGNGSADEGDGDSVTLSVMGLPVESKTEERAAFMADVEAFEDEHPGITIAPSEYQFDSQTFATMLAGGNVPTVLRVPFTEARTIIQRGQAQDITSEVGDLEHGSELNEDVMDLMSDDDGTVFGLPERAYSIGLLYNRSLFEDAGLDPDSPPATWDELRDAAVALKDVAKVPYAELTTNNQGGWHVTMMTYSYGGDIEVEDGDSFIPVFDGSETVDALEMVGDLRWEDDVMGDQQLRDQSEALQQFAAGDIGMWLGSPDVFTGYTTNFDGAPEIFGVGPMPQAGGNATLSGGWTTMVSGTASDAERTAAVEWMDFKNLRQRYDPDVAAEQAAADSDAGVPVGIPEVPLFDEETTTAVNDAISDYVTFPQENAQAYVDALGDITLKAEPPVAGQEIYSALDTVIQGVLADQGADVDALLATAMDQAEAAIGRQQ